MNRGEAKSSTGASRTRFVGIATACVLLVWAASRLPLRELLSGVLAWAEDFGPFGAPIAASLFIPCSILMVPGALIGIAVGFVFDFWVALPSVILFSNLGAQAAFLAGRFLFHKRITAWVERDARRQAVQRAVSDQGLRLVLLLRLSPLIPFNALNYALSISRVPFRSYALGTFLGMLPGTLLFVWVAHSLGSAGRDWTEGSVDTGPMGRALLILGIIAAVVAVGLVTRKARALLRDEL